MEHLRASQRWDALRTTLMRAVRRVRVTKEQDHLKGLFRCRKEARKQRTMTILFFVMVTLVAVIVPMVQAQSVQAQVAEAHEQRELSHQAAEVRYLDEVLTMSARAAAQTPLCKPVEAGSGAAAGDPGAGGCKTDAPLKYLEDVKSLWGPGMFRKNGTEHCVIPPRCCGYWKKRYDEHVDPINSAIGRVEKLDKELGAYFADTTKVANDALINMETQALNECDIAAEGLKSSVTMCDPPPGVSGVPKNGPTEYGNVPRDPQLKTKYCKEMRKAAMLLFGTNYTAQKVKLNDGLYTLMRNVQEKAVGLDRTQWANVSSSALVLVICFSLQGFAVALVIYFEHELHASGATVAECQDRLRTLIQRDWLTSDALPTLRAYVTEDIAAGGFAAFTGSTGAGPVLRAEVLETPAGPPGAVKAGPAVVVEVQAEVAQDEPLKRTVSAQMRQSQIWLSKFRRSVMVQKQVELRREVSIARIPYQKYTWLYATVLVLFQVLSVGCVMVPSLLVVLGSGVVRDSSKVRSLQQHSADVKYYDEVLTMSARMCILTGDGSFVHRYNANLPPLMSAISFIAKGEEALEGKTHLGNIAKDFSEKTAKANDQLVALEDQALANCKYAERQEQGFNALFTSKYTRFKKTYSEGQNQVVEQIAKAVTSAEQEDKTTLTRNTVMIVLIGLLLAFMVAARIFYETRLFIHTARFEEKAEQKNAVEEQEFLTGDALMKLRVGILADLVRRSKRDAEASPAEALQVFQPPKDMKEQIPNLPMSASTTRFVEAVVPT